MDNCGIESNDDENDVTQWVVWRDPSHANTRPIYQCGRDTSNGTSLKPNSREWPPCPAPPVERDPILPPCQHYIFFSFRRGGGKFVVCEHGVERVDLPGHPLPEGSHLLLVALLLLLALPSPVTTSSDVLKSQEKSWLWWGLKNLGSHIIWVIPGLFADPLKMGFSASSSPVNGVVKMKKPSPSDQNGTTLIQTFPFHLESRSS